MHRTQGGRRMPLWLHEQAGESPSRIDANGWGGGRNPLGLAEISFHKNAPRTGLAVQITAASCAFQHGKPAHSGSWSGSDGKGQCSRLLRSSADAILVSQTSVGQAEVCTCPALPMPGDRPRRSGRPHQRPLPDRADLILLCALNERWFSLIEAKPGEFPWLGNSEPLALN